MIVSSPRVPPLGGDRKLGKRGAPEGVRGRRQGEKTVYFIFLIFVTNFAIDFGVDFEFNFGVDLGCKF